MWNTPDITLFILVLVIGVLACTLQAKRCRSMVERWATENDLQLIEMRYSWLSRGPFFWTSSKH